MQQHDMVPLDTARPRISDTEGGLIKLGTHPFPREHQYPLKADSREMLGIAQPPPKQHLAAHNMEAWPSTMRTTLLCYFHPSTTKLFECSQRQVKPSLQCRNFPYCAILFRTERSTLHYKQMLVLETILRTNGSRE